MYGMSFPLTVDGAHGKINPSRKRKNRRRKGELAHRCGAFAYIVREKAWRYHLGSLVVASTMLLVGEKGGGLNGKRKC